MQPLEVRPAAVTAAASAFAIELLVLCALAAQAWSPSLAAGVHLLVIALLSAWTSGSPAARHDLRMPLLLTMMTACLGPFGAGGVLLTMGLTRRWARSTSSFEEWYSALFPDNQADSSTEKWQRLLQATGSEAASAGVTPFADILSFGTLPQKQELITLISKHFRPAFAPVLRMAIGDTNNGIRVQAASAITKIADDFLPRMVELAAAVDRDPTDASCLLALARHHDEYVRGGLLDADREQESRQAALNAYRTYLDKQPDDVDARVAATRLLVSSGQDAEAVRWMEPALDRAGRSPHLMLLYMEALYRLGRLGDLRRVVRSCQVDWSDVDASDVSIEAIETVKLWAEAV